MLKWRRQMKWSSAHVRSLGLCIYYLRYVRLLSQMKFHVHKNAKQSQTQPNQKQQQWKFKTHDFNINFFLFGTDTIIITDAHIFHSLCVDICDVLFESLIFFWNKKQKMSNWNSLSSFLSMILHTEKFMSGELLWHQSVLLVEWDTFRLIDRLHRFHRYLRELCVLLA